MKYNYDFYGNNKRDRQPQPPAHLIKKANHDAKQSFRLYESWQVLQKKIARILSHPDYRDIDEGSDRLVFLGYVGTIMFLAGLFVEWHFSKGIYLSETSYGFLLFIGIVLTGIYCSACFAQLTREYRFKSRNQQVGKRLHPDLYPQQSDKKRPLRWRFLHPLNGLVVFLLVQGLVWYLSSKRVAYQQELDAQAINDAFFPCFLYTIEVIFGIPFYFTLERMFIKARIRQYEIQLTEGEEELKAVVESALDTWYRYDAAMYDYNWYARYNELPQAVRTPPNKYLHRLIEHENGLTENKHEQARFHQTSTNNTGGKA